MRRVILAADVGGTKTHLALYEPDADPRHPLLERRCPSRDAASLAALVEGFLAEAGQRPRLAAFGIAGPVVDNRSDTTNLPWNVDGPALSRALGGAPVVLLNDLEATAWGLGLLGRDDLHLLQAGVPTAGNRALIAAGTGLGEAILVHRDGRHLPSASEGGHTDFGPRDAVEDRLLRWLRARYGGHVSYERVLSGPGIADLYRFFRDDGEPGDSGVERAFDAADDPAAIVTAAALESRCARAATALERFVRIYGAEAGNLALKCLAVGGVYVGGGIAPRMLKALDGGAFLQGFLDKGRLRPVVERIPVSVVLKPQTALWGAAAFAFSRGAASVIEEVS